MPRPHLEPLRRTEILLFEADAEYLIRTFGNGWTSEVRDAVRHWIKYQTKRPKTIGDLLNER